MKRGDEKPEAIIVGLALDGAIGGFERSCRVAAASEGNGLLGGWRYATHPLPRNGSETELEASEVRR